MVAHMRRAFALLPLAAVLVLGSVAASTGVAAADLYYPQPSGPYSVGSTRAGFEDTGRPNLLFGDPNRSIETTVWYPTSATSGPRAKYLSENPFNDAIMAARIAEMWRQPALAAEIANQDTSSFRNAPIRTDLGRLPVVIWQPGLGNTRAMGTSVAEDLASHGYIVIAVDPPDSTIVEYPNGLINGMPVHSMNDADWMNRTLNTRVGDTQKVIGSLSELPLGIGAVADPERIGVTGHSYGGYSAMAAAFEDDRVDAAMAIDGVAAWPGTDTPKPGSVVENGLSIPSMIFGALDGGVGISQESWDQFRQVTQSWFGDIRISGALHHAFTDACMLLRDVCGAIAPDLVFTLTTQYVRAFFDQFLQGSTQPILDPPTQTLRAD